MILRKFVAAASETRPDHAIPIYQILLYKVRSLWLFSRDKILIEYF